MTDKDKKRRETLAEGIARRAREGHPSKSMEQILKNIEATGSPFPAGGVLQPDRGELPSNVVPMRRSRGRPKVTEAQFWTRYREAASECRVGATDDEIAAKIITRSKGQTTRGISLRQLQRLIRTYGRPPDRNSN